MPPSKKAGKEKETKAAAEPAVEETPAVEITEPEKETPPVAKPIRKGRSSYRSVHRVLIHPFQHVSIPTHPNGVELELDSWLQCQINAGLVAEVD